jgi:hypothetical protein
MWFLFPRVRADLPIARWARFVRDLVRERRGWPVPRKHVPSPEPRRRAAEAVGLSMISGQRTVNGRSGALDVTLCDRTSGAAGTRVEIRGLMSHLSLQVEGIETAFQKRMGTPEIEIGDEEFDRALFVQGNATYVRALLGADLRRRLLRAFGGRVRDDSRWGPAPSVVDMLDIAGGTLCAELRDTSSLTADPLEASLAGLLDVARSLQGAEATLAALARNAASDPEPGVRLQNLRVLVREYGTDPETATLLADAADDESQAVRLEAAIARGAEGRPALLSLAAEGWTDDAIATRALDALGPHVPPDRARAVLEHALGADKHATAAACLRALGRAGPDAVPLLWPHVAHARPDVALAAVEALAAAGTVEDVPRLRELEAAGSRALASAARQAVASIQSRLSGASPGQLALAADAGGRVSVADDARGRLQLGRPPER